MDIHKKILNSSEIHHHIYSWIVAIVVVILFILLFYVLRILFFKDQIVIANPGVTYTAVNTGTAH